VIAEVGFVLAKALSRTGSLTQDLGMLIAQTRRRVYKNASRRLEEAGESYLLWKILAHLAREGQLTQSELAMLTAQHPAGVSRLLDELEKQGYVSRRRDPVDRRRVHVLLSARGMRRFEARLPDVIEAVDQALRPLSESERRLLRDLLRKVVTNDD
jgi:DNA-binding MarR family transcriptional regulator